MKYMEWKNVIRFVAVLGFITPVPNFTYMAWQTGKLMSIALNDEDFTNSGSMSKIYFWFELNALLIMLGAVQLLRSLEPGRSKKEASRFVVTWLCSMFSLLIHHVGWFLLFFFVDIYIRPELGRSPVWKCFRIYVCISAVFHIALMGLVLPHLKRIRKDREADDTVSLSTATTATTA